jgi:SNF2 family DNA or RNA helicase
MTDMQTKIYKKIISKKRKEFETEDRLSAAPLAFITNLKKLCNHPRLIYDMCKNREPGFEGLSKITKTLSFTYISFIGCLELFSPEFNPKCMSPEFSGKL